MWAIQTSSSLIILVSNVDPVPFLTPYQSNHEGPNASMTTLLTNGFLLSFIQSIGDVLCGVERCPPGFREVDFGVDSVCVETSSFFELEDAIVDE